ncbi:MULTISPECIES: SusD/RagB family nutrient-binding outer membrane lipoprotein [Arenibacter]|uniref:SusD/RagB family nutrient-binding outer membrane lipoprotein n=1 Tax=Arenibacter TaxID=178469 RepID=UPI000A38C31F|nr:MULTISPECIES: SusD/RagB family nutrient-binding outer membrane lipoprotein [Arenibacter]
MKNILYKIGILSGMVASLVACSDFEEINQNPTAASEEQVQVEYFINNSIIGTQQDPHIAERVFVLYWKAAGRMDRINTLPVGSYNEGWSSDYFRYVSDWLKHTYTAIQVADAQIEAGTVKEYTNNLKQVARIWRAYLMSEMADNFGPMPINGYQGVNPDFNSVEEVYTYMLAELKDAAAELDTDIVVPNNVKNLDPAYQYNFSKWQKYANSLRMRFAMRLSEVDASKAQQEFEDAAASGAFIASNDDNFKVAEAPGWNALTGVMSREWNSQYLSPTLNNLMIGLGGVSSEDQLPAELHSHIKPADYMGLKFEDHFTTLTNDPSAGFWFDGLHENIDPRAYKAYIIPGYFDNPEMNRYPSWNQDFTGVTKRSLMDDNENVVKEVEGAFTWNAPSIGSWGEKGSKNKVYSWGGTVPRLANKFRNSTSERIFFGAWETHFLIAEAAVRGWNVPTSGQAAYEAGIAQSFEYWGVSEYLGEYITSQEYNRAGTSVAWNHTVEPSATETKTFVDGYTDTPGVTTFKYPENTIYQGGSVKNDLLTKIITQKFIAQTPWLPLETWNDHRRLGLPFFENPAIENALPNLPSLNEGNYMTNSVNVFPQRLKYPSNIENNVPEGYQQAVGHLGGPDDVFTPLWWAKQN